MKDYMGYSLDTLSNQEIAEVWGDAAGYLEKIFRLRNKYYEVLAMRLPTEGGYKELWHGIRPFWKKVLILLVSTALVGALAGVMANGLAVLAQILFNFFGFSEGTIIVIVNVLQITLQIAPPLLALAIAQKVANKKIVEFNQKNAQRLEQNKAYNAQLQAQANEIDRERVEVSKKWSRISHLLPESYKFNADALDFMATVLRNGRVKYWGDAMNVYEEEMYRRRIEEKQNELIRQQEEQKQLLIAKMIQDEERRRREEMDAYYYSKQQEAFWQSANRY